MIIVSGVDNTGKTQLVKHLSEKFNIPITRFHTLPPPRFDEWFEWAKSQFENQEEFIYDRFFIDELVYGPIKRGGYGCSIEQMATLSSMLVLRQPLFIYTRPTDRAIFESFPEREQYIEVGDVRKLLNKYAQVKSRWPVSSLANVTRFDYTADPAYRGISKVVKNYLEGGSI